jgi:iron complex outermembrane receptor protein
MRGNFGTGYQRHLLAQATAVMALSVASPATAQTKTFNIPGQSAATSIPLFAKQAGIQLLAQGNMVRGKRTNAVRGSFTVNDALTILLKGTGLTFRTDSGRGIVVIRSEISGDSSSEDSAGTVRTSDSDATRFPSEENSEIVVTATRRPEQLQKVPGSVTAFNAEALRQISPTNIGAVLNLVPGVTFSGESNYRPGLSIRGVTGSNEDAAVAMYLDGVYIGRDLGQNLSSLDPQSIQILRGPQGALYGKNTLGGAIIIDSKAPTFETTGSVLAGYGNANWYNVRGTISTALSGDKLAGSVGFFATGNDGRFRNILTGKNVGHRDDLGGRAALLFKPSETVNFTLRGDYNKNKYEEANRKGLFTTRVFAPNQFSPGYNTNVALDFVGPTQIENYGVSLNSVVEMDPFTVRAVTGYRGYHMMSMRDFDGTGVPQGIGSITQKQHQISQEITLVSSGKKRFNWLAGAQVIEEVMDSYFRVDDLIGGVVIPGFGTRAPVVYGFDVKDYKTTSIAFYAQADFKIFPELTVVGGVRYARDRRSYLKTERQMLSSPTAPGFTYIYNEDRTYHGYIPEASIRYEPTDDVSVYAKYAKSYRPGGFNVNSTFSAIGAGNAFNKETADSYELGLRSALFGRAINLNLTAFRIDWKNQQVSYFASNGAFTVANVQSRSQGVEMELSAKVRRAFEVALTGVYLDATYGDVTLPYRNPVTRVSSLRNANGTPLNLAPKWSLGAMLAYTKEFGARDTLRVRTDLSYKSKQYVTPLREDLAGPAILRINGRIEYSHDRFNAAAFVKNALNRLTNYSATSQVAIDLVGVTEPRTFGIEFGYRY